jgi:hypothetical protein
MEKKTIRAKEVAKDIEQGMNDSDLMVKYELSAKQLEKVLRKLLDVNLITHMQLYERTQLSDTQVTKAFMDSQAAIHELD